MLESANPKCNQSPAETCSVILWCAHLSASPHGTGCPIEVSHPPQGSLPGTPCPLSACTLGDLQHSLMALCPLLSLGDPQQFTFIITLKAKLQDTFPRAVEHSPTNLKDFIFNSKFVRF